MPRAPQPPAKKRGFFANPITAQRRRVQQDKLRRYEELHRRFAAPTHPLSLAEGLRRFGVQDRGRYYYMDLKELGARARRSPEDAALWMMLMRLSPVTPPSGNREGAMQIARVIGQLRRMGHKVEVRDYGDRADALFLRLARRHGARIVEARAPQHSMPDFGLFSSGEEPVTIRRWARDMHTKIKGRRVEPTSSFASLFGDPHQNRFGEGGTLLRVKDDEFITSESFRDNPRLKQLEREGVTFHFVPDGRVYSETFTRMFGKPTFLRDEHVDLSVNVIPEKGVLAVDLFYMREHGTRIRALMRALNLKRVVVSSKEETKYHPANFLELGGGRILVNRDCPNFIAQLRAAGVEVVETVSGLDQFLHHGGGLRCFFNELN